MAGLYDHSVMRVSPVTATLDPVTRVTSVGSVDVIFYDDGTLRSYVNTYGATNSVLTLKLGCASWGSVSEFEQVFTGRVLNCVPSSDKTTITLTAYDKRADALGKTFSYAYLAANPWQILSELVQELGGSAVSVPSTDTHFVTTLVDEDSGVYDPDRRGQVSSIEPLSFTLDDFLMLLGGCVYYAPSTGTLTHRTYDRSASADRHITPGEIFRCEQTEESAHRINQVRTPLNITTKRELFGRGEYVSVRNRAYGSESARLTLTVTDGDAVVRAANTTSVQELPIKVCYNHSEVVGWNDDKYVVATSESVSLDTYTFNTSLTTSVGQTLLVAHPHIGGICGARASTGASDFFTVNWDASLDLDSTHVATFMLRRAGYGNVAYEVFTSEAVAQAGTIVGSVWYDPVFQPAALSYTMTSRDIAPSGSAISVTAPSSANMGPISFHMWDLTIPRAASSRILSRFKDGVPTVSLYVAMRHIDLVLGDVVTFESPVPVGIDMNGTSTSTYWEVCGTEILLDTEEPCIRLDLVYLRGSGDRADDQEIDVVKDDISLDVVIYPGEAHDNARWGRPWLGEG